jgi:hypothetical protein
MEKKHADVAGTPGAWNAVQLATAKACGVFAMRCTRIACGDPRSYL